MQILLVEDLPFYQEKASKAILSLGHNVTVAKTGQDALAVAQKNSFDLVLMDIYLGHQSDFDGFETARRLLKLIPDMIIITFSSQSRGSLIERGKAIGITDYLDKTIFPDEIAKAIEPYIC